MAKPKIKQDIENLISQQAQIETQKANRDEVTTVMTPKGTLVYALLPTTGNEVGHYYYCPDGDGTHGAGNYVWNGTEFYFGGTGDEGYNIVKSNLIDVNNTVTNRLLVTDGEYIIQDVTVVDGSYVYATIEETHTMYNGQINALVDYSYAVFPVSENDLLKISGRANTNMPLISYFNSEEPSIESYISTVEFVATKTICTDYYIAIPFGVKTIAVNTYNNAVYPITIKKFILSKKVSQLWQAGYLNGADRDKFMSVDGTFDELEFSVTTGAYIYSSNGSSYNGQVYSNELASYTVIPVAENDIYELNGYVDTNMQIAVWMSDISPSIEHFVGCTDYVLDKMSYNKHIVTVPSGVSHMGVNTRNTSVYPIGIRKYKSTKSAPNIIQALDYIETDTPLTKLSDDTGMLDIFLNVGCIGDSLASGESCSNESGSVSYHDLYKYSWGQFLARKTGNIYYNWSKGGLTTKTWLASEYATECYDGNHKCQAYIIGLGENDRNTSMIIGTSSDIDLTDYNNNADSYYGNYGKIIQKIIEIVPKAKIFIITDFVSEMELYNDAIRNIANLFDNVYLIDLYKYGQKVFEKLRATIRSGHYGAYGYKLSAMTIASYINWIVIKNPSDFSQVEFIDTEWSWT